LGFKKLAKFSIFMGFILMLALSACGGSETSVQADVSTISITSGLDGGEFAFAPSVIETKAGETTRIVFDNQGTIAHDFEIPDLEIVIETTNAGNKGEITFVAPSMAGSYDFICSIPGHKEAGMVGQLIVN
jgi:uncharacterized cupredoxin-like copper-binding protein